MRLQKSSLGTFLLSITLVSCTYSTLISENSKPLRTPTSHPSAQSAYRPEMDCKNNDIHREVLKEWPQVRLRLQDEQIQKRLLTTGDVYALYDLEIYLHNFLVMVQRCNDKQELQDLAHLLLPIADLAQAQPGSIRKRWICKGGTICQNNRFIGKEIMLPSIQYVGFASTLANAIASVAPHERTAEMTQFLEKYFPLLLESHLGFWSRTFYSRWEANKSIPRAQVPTNFMYAFDDKDMWMLIAISESITAYSKAQGSMTYEAPALLLMDLLRTYNMGIEFLRARLDKSFLTDKNGKKTLLANLDLGAWSRYEDMLFAGYTQSQKPLTCHPNGTKTYNIEKKTLPVIPTVNMDISHARRWVPLFETFVRNEKWMSEKRVLSPDSALSNTDLLKAIATGFAEKVISREGPLFHTYMDGTNGWYRVDYSSGNACREGEGPFSSSYAGPTGGFAFWSDHNPKIAQTMSQIYRLLNSKNAKDQELIEKYYRGLKNESLQRFMFLPSLINAPL